MEADTEDKVFHTFPNDMSESEILSIVRELMGDMPDEDLRTAYESGMFQEFCPDLAEYAANRRRNAGGASHKVPDVVPAEQQETGNAPPVPESESTHPICQEEETNSRDSENEVKPSKRALAGSDSESKHRHQHKKKKKRSKDHKRDKDDKKEKDSHKEKDKDSYKKVQKEDGDKNKDRDRQKEKDVDVDKNRYKEKDRDRHKEREKDRDKHKEKEKDGDRHKEKDKDKGKSSKERSSHREEGRGDNHKEKEKEKLTERQTTSESKSKSNRVHVKKEILSDSDSEVKSHEKKKVTVKKEISDSDSEDDRKKDKKSEKHSKHKKKKTKVVYFSSSSSSESIRSSMGDSNQKSKAIHSKTHDKHAKIATVKIKTEPEEKPKVHPYYQEKYSETSIQVPKKESGVPEKIIREKSPDNSRDKYLEKNRRERDLPEKKKELKPFSKYNSMLASSSLRKWKPYLDREHARYQRRFGLRTVSVLCVDLLDMSTLFHKPYSHQSTAFSVPLDPNMILSDSKISLIKKLESSQTFSFKSQLKRKLAKSVKQNKSNQRDDFSDDSRKPKRQKIIDRIVSSTNSSDSSSIIIPTSNRKHGIDKGKGGKLSKSDRDAEARRRKIDEVKRKAEKFSSRGTRLLAWEKKDEYFKNKVKDEKEKDLAVTDRKRKLEQIKKVKIQQQANAPSTSFQRILAQIEAANKAETRKDVVKLRIPKLSQSGPPKEYKVDGKISCSDVAKEVTRLLSSDIKVECPVLAETIGDMGEYTVRKISWWFLKSEKDPPPAGVFHPELHDDDEHELFEPLHEDDFEWPDDMSSINGCVSDPEGLAADIRTDPKKLKDADWADDYCGQASLYAEIRRTYDPESKGTRPPEPKDAFGGFFKGFLRIKPGTNYEKENFEAKCFLCNYIIHGQRNLGAHIRSTGHKNNFRNYSLNLASYEEDMQPGIPKKEFVAKLVEYSVNTSSSTYDRRDESEGSKYQIAKIESARSDSPRPLIGGEASPGNGGIEVEEMPLPDEISLPSIQDYDFSSDESLQQVRVYLRTKTDFWNADLERRWRHRIDEETKIAELYNSEREYFINEPERHPQYQEEWLKFWNQRTNELEAEGLDPDTYDYQKDWLPFWLKRMQEIMKKEVEAKVDEIKRKYQIDKHSLRSRYGVPAELTHKQEKIGTAGYNASTIKSGEKSTSDSNERKNSSTNKHNNEYDRSKPNPIPASPVSSAEDGEVPDFNTVRSREQSHNHRREHVRHHHRKNHHKSKHSRHHSHQRYRDDHQNHQSHHQRHHQNHHQNHHRHHGPNNNSFTNCDNDGYDVPQPISVLKTRAY